MTDKQKQVLAKIVDKESYLFAEPAILVSRAEMTRLIKESKQEFIKVWSKKLNGVRFRRMVKSGPKIGTPRYNYAAKGYWVVQSQEDQTGDNPYGWRTIVLRSVEKVKIGNQIYRVR